MMKVCRVVSLVAALGLAGVALADPPAPNAQSLGQLEGILKHCAQVDPKGLDLYQGMAKVLTAGVSEDTVAEVRKSSEYQEAYAATLESLEKAAAQDAVKACTDFAAPKPKP